MEFIEYLKSLGASADDIKALTEGSFSATARRAFDKLQADATAAAAERDRIQSELATYDERVHSWYDENNGKLVDANKKLVAKEAEAARYRAAITAARDRGLVDIAKDLGFEDKDLAPVTSPVNTPPGFDPAKYVDRDLFVQKAQELGNNILGLFDMAAEHGRLFPNEPLNFAALKQEADAAKKLVRTYWEEKYKVADARAARSKSDRDAEIAKWKAEGAKERETELVSKYGNPDTRPLMPSTSPFTKRPAGDLRSKLPWETPEQTLGNDRVRRATEKLLQREVTH